MSSLPSSCNMIQFTTIVAAFLLLSEVGGQFSFWHLPMGHRRTMARDPKKVCDELVKSNEGKHTSSSEKPTWRYAFDYFMDFTRYQIDFSAVSRQHVQHVIWTDNWYYSNSSPYYNPTFEACLRPPDYNPFCLYWIRNQLIHSDVWTGYLYQNCPYVPHVNQLSYWQVSFCVPSFAFSLDCCIC